MLQQVIKRFYKEPTPSRRFASRVERKSLRTISIVYKKPAGYKSLWKIKESADHEKSLWTRKKFCGP